MGREIEIEIRKITVGRATFGLSLHHHFAPDAGGCGTTGQTFGRGIIVVTKPDSPRIFTGETDKPRIAEVL